MLDFLKNNILKSAKVLCVELDVTQNGNLFNVSELTIGSKGIGLKKSVNELKSVEEIWKHFKKSRPVLLTITGKPIILRKVTGSNEEIINQIVPGARERDFYFQTVDFESYSISSVARKGTVDKIIQELRQNNLNLIDCSFGGLECCSMGLMTKVDFETKYTKWILGPGNEVVNVEKVNSNDNKTYAIDNESISAINLLNFARGFEYYSEILNSNSSQIELLNGAKQDLLFGNLQKILLALFAVFLLSTVGYNSILMKDYEQKNSILSERNSTISDQSALLEAKKIELSNKQNILQTTGLSLRSRISFYADEIGQNTPNSIQFDKMRVFPTLRNIKEDNQIEFNRNELQISGTAKSSFALNDWINDLKELDWIQEVKIQKFEKKVVEKRGVFQILIKI
jgi:Tfp pilus assembly protein PilN